jgi:hypothetical protein
MDEPILLAGERMGLDIREGLSDPRIKTRLLNRAWSQSLMSNPMAPENSEPNYTLLGSMQPEVTFGA